MLALKIRESYGSWPSHRGHIQSSSANAGRARGRVICKDDGRCTRTGNAVLDSFCEIG